MKAPDKIYLNIPKALYEKDQEIVATWDTQELDDCINPEYIRKDLLLEWAKELEQKRLMGYIMFDELINKLEQL